MPRGEGVDAVVAPVEDAVLFEVMTFHASAEQELQVRVVWRLRELQIPVGLNVVTEVKLDHKKKKWNLTTIRLWV